MVGTLTRTNDPVGAAFHSQTVSLPGGGLATASTVMREVPVEGGTVPAYDIVIQTYDSEGGASGQPIVAVPDVPEGAVLGTFGASVEGDRFTVVLFWPGGDRFGDLEAATPAWDGQSGGTLAAHHAGCRSQSLQRGL